MKHDKQKVFYEVFGVFYICEDKKGSIIKVLQHY